MKITGLFSSICLFVCLASCENDRIDFPTGSGSTVQDKFPLRINEFSAVSSHPNEFGEEVDWCELYNASDSAFTLSANEWYLTDNSDNPVKFPLPVVTLPARSYLII